MGAGIAAHLANAGIPVLLLDMAPNELTADEQAKGLALDSPKVRNRIVNSLFEAAKKLKPAPFMLGDNAKLITTGNWGLMRASSRATSRPDDSGMLKSVTTRSKAWGCSRTAATLIFRP